MIAVVFFLEDYIAPFGIFLPFQILPLSFYFIFTRQQAMHSINSIVTRPPLPSPLVFFCTSLRYGFY